MNSKEPSPLMSVRGAVILLLAGMTGAAGFKLAMLAGESQASSALVAGTAIAGAVYLFNSILGDR